MIEITVLRFDNQKDRVSHYHKYSIEKEPKMKILDALIYINENYNTNLSFRSSCRAGQCGSCGVKVNGEVALACKKEVEDGDIIEPLDFPVLKDLIVDKSEIEEKIAIMKLFLEDCDYIKQEEDKNKIKNGKQAKLDDLTNSKGEETVCKSPQIIPSIDCADTKKVRSCIECFSCLSACPVIKESTDFAGPYFMRYLSKFDFDPRDYGERTEESITEGLYMCTSCGKCGQVCPKEINSFGDAIEKLRALAYKKDLGPLEAHKGIKKIIKETGRSVEQTTESFIKAINHE
ncbi:MAG: 4Fe-4S dicluster domain-containing protein, partial [Methanobrevibacter sp.]|nr:4Fe-4S dicluster domain-containing protein [Candidatus Methanovirga australis]